MHRRSAGKGLRPALKGGAALMGGTALLLCLALPQPGFAQDKKPEQESKDDKSVELAPVNIEALRSITSYEATEGYVSYFSVAATKSDTPAIETPQSVSTIGRQEIEDRGAKTMAEAVRYSPGVTVDNYGVDPRGYDSITIRGFYSSTTGSFRDGLRMDGNAFAAYTTEPYAIERIDVMRGPSGALYGQAEAGGVIDRTTKRPNADMRQEVKVEAGSWDHFQGAFDMGGKANEDGSLQFRLTGLARDSDTEFDYNDGTSQKNNRLFIAPSLTWKGDKTEITFLADYMKDERSPLFNTFANETVGRTNVVSGEPGFDRFDQEQFSVGYTLSHRFDDTFTFRQTARYFEVSVDYQTVSANGLSADNRTLNRYVWAAPDDLAQTAIDNQLEARFDFSGMRHTMLFGFDYSRSVDEFQYYSGAATSIDLVNPVYTGAVLPAAPYLSNEQTLTQTGVYIQDQVKLDNWIVTLGGRYSWVDLDTDDLLTNTTQSFEDSAFTGRVGVTYLFENGLAPYASFIQGFTPKQGTDLFGKPFEPEDSTQYEIGVKYQPVNYNALFTASVYHLTKTNVQTRDPADINNTLQTGEIEVRGLELEAKAGLFKGLDLTAAYAFMDAEVTESNDGNVGLSPVLIPEHTASLWAVYSLQQPELRGLRVGGGLRYVGSAYNDTLNTSENPDYLLVDALVSYAFNENMTLDLRASNLLDEEYTTTCAFGSCYYGPGRWVTAGMTYRW
ncbi:TonB-dependent siderophore receptor [Oceanibaculum nanhaiense]|uniref:TonB-dependent siderophore receptor n=1 Tax=Oceanibaculum nanhaiense TaxID=1909734 RepID=UPI003D2A3231